VAALVAAVHRLDAVAMVLGTERTQLVRGSHATMDDWLICFLHFVFSEKMRNKNVL
jgi:hypothetical protein